MSPKSELFWRQFFVTMASWSTFFVSSNVKNQDDLKSLLFVLLVASVVASVMSVFNTTPRPTSLAPSVAVAPVIFFVGSPAVFIAGFNALGVVIGLGVFACMILALGTGGIYADRNHLTKTYIFESMACHGTITVAPILYFIWK